MLRVGRRTDTRRKHEIVTGALTFVTQSAAGNPEQRIEPIHRLEHPGGECDDPVTTKNVRELATKHDADTILFPRVCALGKENRGVRQSPRCEQRWMRTSEQPNMASDAVLHRDLV